MESSPRAVAKTTVVGQYGEALVAQWLGQQGWSVVAKGWRSRWGELDIVAIQYCQDLHHHDLSGQAPSCLAFVEVKTRRARNWDEDGLYAVSNLKQRKLWKTAQLFLAQHPQWAELPCRFDVALVQAKPSVYKQSLDPALPIRLGQPVVHHHYELTLHTYLPNAFELSN
jgi:putative endonuclease